MSENFISENHKYSDIRAWSFKRSNRVCRIFAIFLITPVYKRDAMTVRIQFVSVFKDGKLEIDFQWAVLAVDEKLPFRILL